MRTTRRVVLAILIFTGTVIIHLNNNSDDDVTLTVCEVLRDTAGSLSHLSEVREAREARNLIRDNDLPIISADQDMVPGPTIDIRELSDEMRKKIWNQQNPDNCDEARLLIYDIHLWERGFACTAHVILMHFLLAFYTNRTFVLKSDGWIYDEKGWDHYLMPLGKCNYDGTIKSLPVLSDTTSNDRVVRSVDKSNCNKCDWKIPNNILQKLKKVHRDPYAWWIGQFMNYELRFQPWFMEILSERQKKIGFTDSTAGVQIRWGDKVGLEANKHYVGEYMDQVSKWFEMPQHQGLKRTVYVATEQSEAWRKLEDNFHEFTFIGSGFVDRNVELDYRRGSFYAARKNELEAILMDVYFLTKCQYVVCTFSSNICRLLYEMSAVQNTSPGDAIQSLDGQVYYLIGFTNFHVIEDHNAQGNEDSIDLKIGDIFEPSLEGFNVRRGYILGVDLGVGIDLQMAPPVQPSEPRNDGYILGVNHRTGQRGRVPKHKLDIIVNPLDFDV